MKPLIFLLLLLPLISFSQISYKKVNLEVDFTKTPVEYNNYWNSTGFTPGDLLLRKDMQLTLDYLSCLPNDGMKYIRPHWMLNLVGSKNAGTKNAEFNFEKLDLALDQIVTRGFIPIFEIMGFPNQNWVVEDNKYDKAAQSQKNETKQWVPDFNKKEDYLAWHAFVIELVQHFEQRYGSEKLKNWYFECTNEPDITKVFWKQGIPALLNYWDATSEAIKKVNTDYKIGGPGTARLLTDEFKSFLAHCDTGLNAITGKQGASLDFISIHTKERPYQMVNNEFKCINYIRENHPRFAQLPFWNDEADPMAGWSRPYWWRADAWYAAFVAHSVDVHNRINIDSLGVNFAILANDNGFMGNWYKRTHLAKHSNPDDKDKFWLFKQPDLTVMSMLSLATGKRFPVDGFKSTRENVAVIASETLNGQKILIVVNKPEFGKVNNNMNSNTFITPEQKKIVDAQGADISFSLKGLNAADAKATIIRLDNSHGNAYTNWVQLGMPDSISTREYHSINANQEPVIVSNRNVDENLNLMMPPSSVCMVVLHSNENKEIPMEVLETIPYKGFNGEDCTFIRWNQLKCAISTYDIFASENGVDFKKINLQPLFDTGFLHVKNTNKEYRYKVVSRSL